MTGQALIPRRELEEIERRVVDAALRTMDAMPKLQYGGREVTQETVREILRRPAVQFAMRAAIKRRVATELVPNALHYLGEVVRDEHVSTRERITAAKALVDLADLKRDGQGDSDDKPLADMNPDELKAFLSAARAEIATRSGEEPDMEPDMDAPPRNPTLSLKAQKRKGKPIKKAAATGPRKRDLFA